MVEFIKKTGKKRAGLFCRFFLYYFFLMEAQVHLVVYPGFQHIGTFGWAAHKRRCRALGLRPEIETNGSI